MSIFKKEITYLGLEQLKKNEKRWIGGLLGSATALLLKEICLEQPQQLFVVIAKNSQNLVQLESELAFYGLKAHVFPDWEILPYDRLSPHQDIVSERLAILSNMPNHGVLLMTAAAAAQRVAPASWLLGEHFDIRVGDRFDLEAQKAKLIQAGYYLVDTVYDHGEFAVRGNIVDIYASGQDYPIRIDLFDDEVETLKFFDSETQRTTESLERFSVLPAKEFPLKDGRSTFRDRYAEMFPRANAKKNPFYQDVLEGISSPGIEFYFPLFFNQDDIEKTGYLSAYLPTHAVIITENCLEDDLQHFWQDTQYRYEDRKHNVDQPLLAPEMLFLKPNQVQEQFNQFRRIYTSTEILKNKAGVLNIAAQMPAQLAVDIKKEQPFIELTHFIQKQAKQVLLVAETAGRRESLKDALRPHLGDIAQVGSFDEFLTKKPNIAITHAALDRGLQLTDGLTVISESQLY